MITPDKVEWMLAFAQHFKTLDPGISEADAKAMAERSWSGLSLFEPKEAAVMCFRLYRPGG